MKKSKILSMFIVSTMLLAGCQSATDVAESVNTDSVTVSETTSIEKSVEDTETAIEDTEQVVSETVSETTSIEENNDVQVWVAAYAEKVYTELQSENGLTFENMYNPEYAFTVTPVNIGEENEMLKMNADIAFIDIDFDGIPEMFLGCHGTSHSAHIVYNLNGEKLGVVHSGYLSDISSFDGKLYFMNNMFSWVKAENGMPAITVNYLAATDSYTVNMYENSKCVNTVEDVKEEEITQYYEKFMEVSLKDIQDNKTDSVVRVIDYLRVPDTENYTETDIEACIASLLQQYINQI